MGLGLRGRGWIIRLIVLLAICCLFDIVFDPEKEFQNGLSLGRVRCYNLVLCKNQCILINT